MMVSASAGKTAMRRSQTAWSAYACEIKSLRGNPRDRPCVRVKNRLSHIVGQYIAPDAASGDAAVVGTLTSVTDQLSMTSSLIQRWPPSWLLSDTFTPPECRLGSGGPQVRLWEVSRASRNRCIAGEMPTCQYCSDQLLLTPFVNSNWHLSDQLTYRELAVTVIYGVGIWGNFGLCWRGSKNVGSASR